MVMGDRIKVVAQQAIRQAKQGTTGPTTGHANSHTDEQAQDTATQPRQTGEQSTTAADNDSEG